MVVEQQQTEIFTLSTIIDSEVVLGFKLCHMPEK